MIRLGTTKARLGRFEEADQADAIAEDADALGCRAEVESARDILTRGTSAHRQLRDYGLERASGASDEDALKAVVDTLIADTAEGV